MTLVSYAHGFIYLRTRKTASTSTEMYLQPFCMPPERAVIERSPRQIISRYGIVGRRLASAKATPIQNLSLKMRRLLGKTNWSPHMPAATVRAALDREFWDRALKISSVRNPYARLVSAFYWGLAKSGGETDDPQKMIRKFRRMVRRERFADDRDIVMINGAFVPDVLIRMEHLAEDLAAVSERLGLDPTRTHLAVTKKTKSSDAAARPGLHEFYDDETAQIVQQKFNWAFAHGGYSTEVPA